MIYKMLNNDTTFWQKRWQKGSFECPFKCPCPSHLGTRPAIRVLRFIKLRPFIGIHRFYIKTLIVFISGSFFWIWLLSNCFRFWGWKVLDLYLTFPVKVSWKKLNFKQLINIDSNNMSASHRIAEYHWMNTWMNLNSDKIILYAIPKKKKKIERM